MPKKSHWLKGYVQANVKARCSRMHSYVKDNDRNCL